MLLELIGGKDMFWARFRSSVILMIVTVAALVLGGNVMRLLLHLIS